MESVWIFAVLIMRNVWSVQSAVPLSFELGSYVNLTCGDLSKPLLHVIWSIWIKNEKCSVTFKNETQNSCRDGLFVSKQNGSQTVLHVPNFSKSDAGKYNCESVHFGLRNTSNFTLSVTTPPRLSSWFEWSGDTLVAVCKAEGANPAANISWKHAGNSLVNETRSIDAHLHTTESRLTLLERCNHVSSVLVCSVRHVAWKAETLLSPQRPGLHLYQVCLISVISSIFVLAVMSCLLYKHRKSLISRCRGRVDASLTELQQKEDVEEVEPYASYVQRVNSIYNS